MLETEVRQRQKADWTAKHTLTKDQLKQLILNKFVRATQYQEAVRKREVLLKHR